MSKRKKKKLRDKFTDALGEEISSRKIVEKIQPKPKVDLTKKNKPKPKKIKSQPKVEEIKVDEIKVVEVEVDAELEKRIFTEADNTFLDEKPKRPARRLTSEGRVAPNRPTFRTRSMVEKIEDEKNSADKKNSNVDADLHRKLSRAETTGAVLSLVMLIYSLTTSDTPLFFLALSLLTHVSRSFIGAFFGKYNRPVQNALRGFSIAVFIGSLILLFI